MDKIEKYRKAVMDLIKKYGNFKPSNADVDVQLIFDTERDHYLLYTVGWQKDDRAHGCVFHFDIIGGKVWIQHNGTDVEVGEELMERGVERDDIVVAIHPPEMWKYTDYAKSA